MGNDPETLGVLKPCPNHPNSIPILPTNKSGDISPEIPEMIP
jgi:hypothetical protein